MGKYECSVCVTVMCKIKNFGINKKYCTWLN